MVAATTRLFANGIQKIEALRENNPDFDSLLSELKYELMSVTNAKPQAQNQIASSQLSLNRAEIEELAELIVAMVFQRLKEKHGNPQEHDSHDAA